MWRLACLCVAGCTAVLDMGELRVEPATIDLDVDLAQPAPGVALRVLAGDNDVTGSAAFTLTGPRLGAVSGGRFESDGRTGGSATLAVTAAGKTATIPVTAHVHGTRLVGAAPSVAPAWFAAASDVAVNAALEPGDGA